MRQLVALLVGLAVALFASEVVLRLLWDGEGQNPGVGFVVPVRTQRPDVDRRIPRRGIHPDWEPVRFRTDARGYILPQGASSAEASWTLAFLGGSTTECLAVPESARFPARVGQRLGSRGLTTRTLNAARSAATLHDSLNLLLNHLPQDGPDLAIVMHAVDDAGVLRRDGDYRSRSSRRLDGAFLGRALADAATRRLLSLAFLRSRLGDPGAGGGFGRPHGEDRLDPEPFAARLRAFAASARALGMRPVFLTQPIAPGRTRLTPGWVDPPSQRLMNETVRVIAQEREVALVDLARRVPELATDHDRPFAIFYDGMHVTERGSELYAEILSDALWNLRPSSNPP